MIYSAKFCYHALYFVVFYRVYKIGLFHRSQGLLVRNSIPGISSQSRLTSNLSASDYLKTQKKSSILAKDPLQLSKLLQKILKCHEKLFFVTKSLAPHLI